MSSAVSCPRCNRLVALPSTGDPTVWLRCPLCREEYRLIDVLNYAPPMLEVIAEPHETVGQYSVSATTGASPPVLPAPQFGGAFATGPQLTLPHVHSPHLVDQPGITGGRHTPPPLPKVHHGEMPGHLPDESAAPTNSDGIPDLLTEPGHEYQSRPDEELLGASDEFSIPGDEKNRPSFAADPAPDDMSDAPAFAAEGESPAGDAAEDSPWRQKPGLPAFPSTQHIHARRQRKPSNPIAELAKIVIGGAVGLLLGYFIVLWGLKLDLLHIAKHLPSFLVPESLRATDSTSAKNDQTEPVAPSTAPSTEPKWNPYAMPPKEQASTSGSKPIVHTPDIPPPDDLKPNELKPSEPKPIEPKPNDTAQATSLSSDAMASKPRDGAFPPPPELPPEPPLVPEGPKTEKTFAYGDAAKAMSDATAAAAEKNGAPEDLEETNPAEYGRLRKTYYVALAKLAETVTMLRPQAHDDKESTARHAAAALVQGIADDEAKLQELGALASAWLTSAKRTDIGIVLAGVAQKPESVGKQYRTVVRLYGNSKPIAVLTSGKPELTDGNPALVLGVIVDDPAKNLHDYHGDDERVIWAAAAVDPTHPTPGDSSGDDGSKSDSSQSESPKAQPMEIGL